MGLSCVPVTAASGLAAALGSVSPPTVVSPSSPTRHEAQTSPLRLHQDRAWSPSTVRGMEIRFQPWVGEQYGRSSRWGLSLLVLGDSHYHEYKHLGQAEYTNYIVREYIDGKTRPFFTNFAASLDPTLRGVSTRNEIWQSLAFYNYVQDFMEGPDLKPSRAQFASSWQPFLAVVRDLRPDLIVVCGYRLWDAIAPRLPTTTPLGFDLSEGRPGMQALLPQAAPGAGVISYIKHPSRAYSGTVWQPVLTAMMAAASPTS